MTNRTRGVSLGIVDQDSGPDHFSWQAGLDQVVPFTDDCWLNIPDSQDLQVVII